jgi:lipopolysaccharide export system protein LptA
VWTPKRIVLLVAGFVIFTSGYAVYANFLGGIDGLPPLPECYLSKVVADPGSETSPLKAIRHNPLEDKLQQAFGSDCEELNRPIKLELHARRTVLAAQDFEILPDGRIHLVPLSLALFGAEHGDGRGLEINTLRADQAYLTFDRPIANISEIGSRKIVAAELYDHIRVTNNHRTPARDDDLQVDIGHGPLYYSEEKHLIWTKDDVRVTDYQSKPKPTEISGHMMDMELFAEAPPGKTPVPRKPKGETVSGVKSIVLHSDVVMQLYVDGQSGFPGGNSERPANAPPAKRPATGPTAAPEKAHITIRTPGMFRYDVFKDYDTACFDVPEAASGRSPRDVHAIRSYDSLVGKKDQLVCKHLELRLRRKEAQAKAGQETAVATSPDKSLDIETARATGPDGLVVLTSDSELLTARGSDFFYDAPKMLTVLKGQPMMEADKDHNVIRARELWIQDHKPVEVGGKGYQTTTGIGPGTVDLIDKNTTPYHKAMRATWRDKLVSSKDGPHDLLVFTGAACFLDYEHDQTLSADTLKVWLQPKEAEPPGAAAAPAPGSKTDPEKSQRPDHLEAIGNVAATSAQLKVYDTGLLVVWFKDVPVDSHLPAAVAPLANATKKGPAVATPASMPRPLPAGPATPEETVQEPAKGAAAPGTPPSAKPVAPVLVGPPKPAEPPRPIDLSARRVEAWVLRSEERNTLEKVWCEGPQGTVRVKQAPATPEDKGVDIKGDTLQMIYHPEGNFLVVTGDLAQLLMDKIYIVGPEVNIDQATNKAWVTGAGGMVMESKTNFQGDQLAKPVPLNVQWTKSMFFDGNYAEFHENIQAVQESAYLLCQRLEVHFDRAISLKEGAKGDQPPARVQNLVCDHSVDIFEETKDGEKLIKYQNLTSPWVTMNALEPDEFPAVPVPAQPGAPAANNGNEVRASGPGTLRIWQAGGIDPGDPQAHPAAKSTTNASGIPDDPMARPTAKTAANASALPDDPMARPAAKTAANASGKHGDPTARPATKTGANPSGKPEEQMKLTYVSFEKSMYANSKKNKADFYENVRVLNFPSDNPRMKISFDEMLEKMPQGGMYIRCDQMEVLNHAVKGGHSHQEMTAVGHVTVQSNNVSGRAAKVTYNEEKDQLIFDGVNGTATLYKVETPGAAPKMVEGKKITYIRKTGEYKVDQGSSLTGG